MALCNDPRIRTLLCVLRGSEAHFLWVIHWGISHQWRCLSPSCWLLKKGLCSTDWAWERCLVCSSCQVDLTGVLRFACWLMLIVAVRVGLETYSWNFLNSSFCWCCCSCHRCRCCGGCFRLCWLLVACYFLPGLSRGASTAGFCADLSWKPMWWQNR